MGGWTAWDGRADKQKAPSVFISVTFGCSVIALLHAKQRASAAEGRAEKKKKEEEALMAKASFVQCLYSQTHSTDGSGNRVPEVRAPIIKKGGKKPRLV